MILLEKLSFDKLLAYSEPKRIERSKSVRGPALDVEAFRDSMWYYFNFRSFPSTTGRRHQGYIKFDKPGNPNLPLEKVPCEVDCSCPDFKFRHSWAVKQKGSSRVGPNSLNGAWNKAPRITNPTGRPGLCKHLIALRDFLYGQDSRFIPAADDEDPTKLKKLLAKKNTPTLQDLTDRGHFTVPGVPEENETEETDLEASGDQAANLERNLQSSEREAVLQQRASDNRRGILPGLSSSPTEENRAESIFNYVNNKSISIVEEMAGAEAAKVKASPSDEALAALKSIENLLAELVALNQPDQVPTEGATEEPGEELEVPELPKQEEPEEKIPNYRNRAPRMKI